MVVTEERYDPKNPFALQNLWERLQNVYHYWGYLLYDWRVRRAIVVSL